MKIDLRQLEMAPPSHPQQGDAANRVGSSSRNPATEAALASALEIKECKDLIEARLSQSMIRLIHQLTGVPLHVIWHGSGEREKPGKRVAQCPAEPPKVSAKSRPAQVCECCLQFRWPPAKCHGRQERRFFGKCGLTNYCALVKFDDGCPLSLILQARVRPRDVFYRADAKVNPSGVPREPGGATVGPAAFRQAVALVRLVLHDLEVSLQAWRTGRELERAMRRMTISEAETARLREELCHRLPGLPELNIQPGSGNRTQKVVGAMLDYVHKHSHEPISLRQLALEMKMNAAYLSAVFTQTTGVNFHHFLKELRLSKARALLCDPRNRVREVACATGYASPDAFRHAFKAQTGLSPEAWRAG